MHINKLSACLLFFLSFTIMQAEEGMWIPSLLEKYGINQMHEKGFKLSAREIYNINQACLKDAVVFFGSGCTGVLISEEGLVLTNHHCGYRYIQSHSTVEKNYLANGFWAMSREEELPNRDLTVTFLIRIEDVSKEILKGTSTVITEQQIQEIITENIDRLKIETEKNTGFKAIIKPFFYGNEYYMFIYKLYSDIRLVGAPPSTIGNFGEDYDNWKWPRHCGDFSLFRIYADKNNDPANYSPDNVPYKPRKYLSISVNGFKENDFTMVLGYPGSTSEYLISDGIKVMTEISLPKKIKLREERMNIISRYMNQNEHIRIQYASKYRNINNNWKKWQGIIHGIHKYKAVAKKEIIENQFEQWLSQYPEKQKIYGGVLKGLKDMYKQLSIYLLAYEYTGENILGTEIINLASDIRSFFKNNKDLPENEKVIQRDLFIKDLEKFFKDYNKSIDTEVFELMLRSYYSDIDPSFHPDIFKTINKKFKGDFGRFARSTMNKTLLTSLKKLKDLFYSYPENESQVFSIIMNDPVYQVLLSYSTVYNGIIIDQYDLITKEINILYRTYLKGLMDMDSLRVKYPDANSTMRVSFGKIEGYQPSDAVFYSYYSTLDGVIEKAMFGGYYAFPSKLYQLYIRKDYGPWKNADGKIPVCFVASNHTSGGNSGSPVLDANGYLIGINFDRNWEGTMSDLWYDPLICRNISVDIRYILFIIDKYADATYLIDEIDLIWD